jgi:hypothetical protein
MKKTLLSSVLVLLVGLAIAQPTYVSTTPTNRVAVLEEYTGNYCTYCPDGHRIASDDIEPTGAITLKIQTGGFSSTDPVFGGTLQTPTGELIAGPFDSQGYPNGSVSRKSGNTGIGRGEWVAAVNAIQSQASPVNVYVGSTIDVTTRQLIVTVEYYYTGAPSSATNYLHIGYYQDNVAAYQYDPGFNPNQFYLIDEGIYDFDHCFRDMINGTWGQAITGLAQGSTAIITDTITLPTSFSTFDTEPGAIKVFAFISQSSQGEIITAAKATPTFTNWPSTNEAGLIYATSIKNENCVGKTGSYVPKVLIAAYGSDGLNSIDLAYGVNGGTANQSLTSLGLGHNEKKAVSLTSTPFTYETTNNFNLAISNPNGSADPTSSDNTFSGSFNGGNTGTAEKIRIQVKGDAYMADEASFKVKDGSGAVVLDVPLGTMVNNTTSVWDLSLPDGVDCYSFELYDDYGDGWGYNTTSFFKVSNYTGSLVGAIIKNINTKTNLEFAYVGATELTSNGTAVGIMETEIAKLNVYPNPASDVLNVSFYANQSDYAISLNDLQGRTISTQKISDSSGEQLFSFLTDNIAKGSYIVVVSSDKGQITKNVVIK